MEERGELARRAAAWLSQLMSLQLKKQAEVAKQVVKSEAHTGRLKATQVQRTPTCWAVGFVPAVDF